MANKVFNVVKNAAKKFEAKRVNENVKRRNKRFQNLGLMQQRVAIAKDALALLDMEKLIARRGTYLSAPYRQLDELDKLHDDGASCAVQLEAAETCQACALGAVFAGAIRRGAVDCKEFDVFSQADYSMRDMLKPYFSNKELWDMENFFESGYSQEANDRLRAVLNTIIESGGEKVRPDNDPYVSEY